MSRNPITIEVLETLDAIERRGSFAKAAEDLNKATSAVSYAVQKLEEQLDIALFQRQGRRSVLTPAGKLVLEEGRVILQFTARLANKAKEVATGWEPRIKIGIESLLSYSTLFQELNAFLQLYPSIDLDVCECVLNGGWEALDQGRVDLIVGSPGPVPMQKGIRTRRIRSTDLIMTISSKHAAVERLVSSEAEESMLDTIRRVISHDTSITDIARSAGLSHDGKQFFVQNMDQKVAAILAGIGIGHLPKHRIQSYLDQGELIELKWNRAAQNENFIAWKSANKGKGLQILSQQLARAFE